MCTPTCISFGTRMLTRELVAGRDVIEVGALDVNGSLRSHVEALKPATYLGVDMQPGPGVDEVANAAQLVSRYGGESFDLVITTEMLEHTRNWPEIVSNLKGVLRPGGHLLVTTRSPGFPYHAYPYDFWRYEPDDMRVIFGDLNIVTIESDSASPGVFMLARRPEAFEERAAPISLFSIITGHRSRSVSDLQVQVFTLRQWIRLRMPKRRPRFRVRRRLQRYRRSLIRARNATWRLLPGGARSFLKRVVFRRA
jgi:SAM-dependent methyltransferase